MNENKNLLGEVDKRELDALVSKIKTSRDDLDKLSVRRKTCFDAFTRKPFQDDDPDLARYQAGDVMEQVEATYPALMGRVLASDHQIRFKGPDPLVCKALLVRCREIIASQNAFLLYSCAIKDGLLSVSGFVKLWWSRVYRKVVDRQTGVPESKVAILEAALEAGAIQGLEISNPRQEAAIYDPADGITGPIKIDTEPTYDCTVTLTELEKSEPVIVPIPPEQVLAERGKASVNDKRGIGHQTVITVGDLLAMQDRLSMPGEPFFDEDALTKAIELATKDESSGQQSERAGREELHFNNATEGRLDFDLTTSKLRRPITMVEWSDTVPLKDRLESVLTWFASDVPLRVQKNSEGIVPMCGWSPYIIPHSLHGMGVAEQHIDEQDARTLLGRALLNHVARVVDEEVYILNQNTDIMGLKNRHPGQVVYAEPDKDFKRGTSATLDAQLLKALDFIKTDITDKGPANRWTMGGDVDPSNTTATGQQIMARASSARQNMIALVFTECFQVDMYSKIARLLQENTEDFTVLVEGQKVTLTRDQIQGAYTAYSEVGRQFDVTDRDLQRAQMIAAAVEALAKSGMGLVTPQNVYNAAKRLFLALGEPNAAEFITPPPKQLPPAPPGALPPGAPQIPGGAPPGAPEMPDQTMGQDTLNRTLGVM